MKFLFNKVAIIGVGLIGGSFGMAIRHRNLAELVVGLDVDQDNLRQALENDAIHKGAYTVEEAVCGADLVIIATPVGLTVEFITRLVPYAKKGCIITDVGSTKSKIVEEADRIVPEGIFFIGGHPMAGSEIAGVKGADPYLFENAVYVLTPSSRTSKKALDKVRVLAGAMGAKVLLLDSREHDLMVAAVSHLPHLIATGLVNTAGELQNDHDGLLMLAAGGFRDTTRIASGHPLMWKDICLTNSRNILEVLEKFASVMERLRTMIENCDDQGLEGEFVKAKRLRTNIPSKVKGYLSETYEIIVTVPDQPGMIGILGTLLGQQGVNIKDIEILRVREGEGGTIKIAVSSEEQQARALNVLQSNNIKVRKR